MSHNDKPIDHLAPLLVDVGITLLLILMLFGAVVAVFAYGWNTSGGCVPGPMP